MKTLVLLYTVLLYLHFICLLIPFFPPILCQLLPYKSVTSFELAAGPHFLLTSTLLPSPYISLLLSFVCMFYFIHLLIYLFSYCIHIFLFSSVLTFLHPYFNIALASALPKWCKLLWVGSESQTFSTSAPVLLLMVYSSKLKREPEHSPKSWYPSILSHLKSS